MEIYFVSILLLQLSTQIRVQSIGQVRYNSAELHLHLDTCHDETATRYDIMHKLSRELVRLG